MTAGQPFRTFGAPDPGIEYKGRVGSYGVLLKDGNVLLEKTYQGHFLPGGGVDDGETLTEALEREFLEETGYQVQSVKALPTVIQYIYLRQKHKQKICNYFLVEGTQAYPEPVKPDCNPDGSKHTVEWIPIEQAVKSLLLESDRWAVEEFAKG